MHDDREEFEDNKRRQCAALGCDETIFQGAVKTLVELDRYDYSYLWSWLGVPIIQLPADVMATQEVVWSARPDVIIETGVARGGSMIFLASLLKLLGGGKVIGVYIDIRAHNRELIQRHPLSDGITLIEGGSVSDETLARVRAEIPHGAKVMVILDSDHSRDHVLAELRVYGPLVTAGPTTLRVTPVGAMPWSRSTATAPAALDQLCVNTIRTLVDGRRAARELRPSGHADGARAARPPLFTRHLKHDPAAPDWADRDRFVLSCGHASMLLYSLLHLSGYEVSLDDLRDFRQLH